MNQTDVNHQTNTDYQPVRNWDSGHPWIEEFLDSHEEELIAFRRQLHAYPELSHQEYETTAAIASRLNVSGIEPTKWGGKTGLWADLGKNPKIAIRADIDALALDDGKDVLYRSRNAGVTHACGHDVHSAIVLGIGLGLVEGIENGLTLPSVRLIFEHAEEEVPGGAVEMIANGVLDGINVVYGLHCDPKLSLGRVMTKTGAISSAADLLVIRFEGKGGHTARPEGTSNIVSVVGRIAHRLPIELKKRSAGEVSVVFGSVSAGDAPNVIPSGATLTGTVRTPELRYWKQADEMVKMSLDDLLVDTDVAAEIDYRKGVPPVVNDAEVTATFESVASELLGDDFCTEAPQSRGGDSFAWYGQEVPSCYFRLGTSSVPPAERTDIHSGNFDVDERCIGLGVRLLFGAILASQE